MPNRIGSGIPTAPTVGPAASDGSKYQVQSGDTLAKIASKFGVTTAALVTANQARYPALATNALALQANWSLDIPQGGTPGQAPFTPANVGWKPRSNDRITFVAMNNSAEHHAEDEAKALTARGADVQLIKDQKDADADTITTTRNGVKTRHDLTTREGATSFALTLGLPADQTKKIAEVLLHADSDGSVSKNDGRDELAQIAQTWAEAERGGQIPSRLILSGHHVGGGVYGENNGRLAWPWVAELSNAMPRGASTVEDLMIAGCYSGGQDAMEKYQSMFPAVKTIVAYNGSSPGAASGATAHQKAWEQATRGDKQTIDRKIFDGMRKGENVAVWTKAHGYQDGKPPASRDELLATRANYQADYDKALKGDVPIADPQTGTVRDFYNYTQRLIQHPDTTPAQRTELEGVRDQTIRLLFYPVVAGRFADANAAKVDAGFRALGLPVPNFKTMSRKEALTALDGFQAKLQATPNAPGAATQVAAMLQDFRNLKPNAIPDTWV